MLLPARMHSNGLSCSYSLPSLLKTTLGKSVISKKKREVPRSTSLSLSIVVLPLLPHYASLDLSWEESYSYSY